MSVLLDTPPPPRSPWQRAYARAHELRRRWYRKRARRLPRPVVSFGNLHWGGGGKTPLTAAVAAHLRDRGLQVAILTRGYRSRGRGVRIVSRGEGPLLGPRLAGDEPVLLAGQLKGVAIVVCPDRYRGGRHALERLDRPPDLFLLDDGFSHLALHRDVDLLAFPVADPFGGGRLPPSGRLREPLSSVERADAVLLTGNEVPADSGPLLAAALRPHGLAGPGFAAPIRTLAPHLVPEGPLDPAKPVLTVTAIARPAEFRAAVRRLGLQISDELVFPDHHPYPAASLAKIARAFRRSGAATVLTTSKDRVKLQGRLELPLAEIPIRSEPEPAFFVWLEDRLSPLLERAP